ncbi:MAG: PIN domain-containing protein [Chlorobium sp.]|uniref:PIN domain-containing protein n=1 Tax=Chlorobium sp. TaxID=1095 RepID=UPI0025C6205A|nr:PIN domain-containing protein [Chlorobium sp.]MCF8382867.1 PIN domain-containing protein [Chlorobium sp.]
MKALDTNILVRFLVKDDKTQAERVYRLFREAEENGEAFLVPAPVVLELLWVLESAYAVSRNDLLDALEQLLLLPVIEFDRQPAVRAFVSDARKSRCDLADLFIAHYATQTCSSDTLLTFDKKAARSPLFTLLA